MLKDLLGLGVGVFGDISTDLDRLILLRNPITTPVMSVKTQFLKWSLDIQMLWMFTCGHPAMQPLFPCSSIDWTTVCCIVYSRAMFSVQYIVCNVQLQCRVYSTCSCSVQCAAFFGTSGCQSKVRPTGLSNTLMPRLPLRIALHCTSHHCTALHCTALHCTSHHIIALHCTALQCTAYIQSTNVKL